MQVAIRGALREVDVSYRVFETMDEEGGEPPPSQQHDQVQEQHFTDVRVGHLAFNALAPERSIFYANHDVCQQQHLGAQVHLRYDYGVVAAANHEGGHSAPSPRFRHQFETKSLPTASSTHHNGNSNNANEHHPTTTQKPNNNETKSKENDGDATHVLDDSASSKTKQQQQQTGVLAFAKRNKKKLAALAIAAAVLAGGLGKRRK